MKLGRIFGRRPRGVSLLLENTPFSPSRVVNKLYTLLQLQEDPIAKVETTEGCQGLAGGAESGRASNRVQQGERSEFYHSDAGQGGPVALTSFVRWVWPAIV